MGNVWSPTQTTSLTQADLRRVGSPSTQWCVPAGKRSSVERAHASPFRTFVPAGPDPAVELQQSFACTLGAVRKQISAQLSGVHDCHNNGRHECGRSRRRAAVAPAERCAGEGQHLSCLQHDLQRVAAATPASLCGHSRSTFSDALSAVCRPRNPASRHRSGRTLSASCASGRRPASGASRPLTASRGTPSTSARGASRAAAAPTS